MLPDLFSVRLSIEQGDLQSAVSKLIVVTNKYGSKYRNEALVHSSTLNQLRADVRTGVLSVMEEFRVNARITRALLDLLDDLELEMDHKYGSRREKELNPVRTIVQLTGTQFRQLTDALIEAFPSEAKLERMVRFGLIDKPLASVASGEDLTEIVFNLITWAVAQGMTEDLIIAARTENPRNPSLRMFAEQVQLAAAPLSKEQIEVGELERIIFKSVRFANVAQWRELMSESELAVCRVEIVRHEGTGTGFLLGPSIVMTNYHVIEDIHNKSSDYSDLVLRFDYKTGPDGKTLRHGVEYALARDWLIDYSKEEHLDYALLRIKGQPGNDPVGDQQGAPQRGWLTPEPHKFEAGEPLFIIQHPQAAPLKFAAGHFLKASTNPDRIFYKVNTEPGSSGSPCFTSDWDLVGLHHYGLSDSNQGIPMSIIAVQPKVKAALAT